ncbi:MAG: hypothetical protein ACRDNW_26515 [Trebonia sp.]
MAGPPLLLAPDGATKSLAYGLGAAPAVTLRAPLACFLIRTTGIRYNLNAPIAREARNGK